MATQQPAHKVEKPVPVDIPDERQYDTEPNAELDRKLCATIEAAEQAGNDYLARMLVFELGSHYHESQ